MQPSAAEKSEKKITFPLAKSPILDHTTSMKDQESNTTQPEVSENGIWINPLTGRELGATLDDLIEEMKKNQK